jgi:putative ABC transport system permease protein
MNDWLLALRRLRQQPRFTVFALLTLVLGIGANTAIFSVVNAVLLAPLPFRDPDQLIALGGHDTRDAKLSGPLNTLSFPEFFDLRSRSKSFSQLAAYRERTFAWTRGAGVESVHAQRVTGNFFDTLAIEPALGRTFTIDDERPGGGAGGLVVVLSHDFWRRQFDGNPSAVGHVMTLDGLPFSIIGVLPAGFRFPIQGQPTDIYVSIAIDGLPAAGQRPNTEQRNNRQLRVVGRLEPQAGIEQARAEVHELAGFLARMYPTNNTNWDYVVRPLGEYVVANVRTGLWILWGAVGLVLLISCVNVASLLLARAAWRRREVAVRLALGATRARIIRQLLVESVLLSAIAGALGLLIAVWFTRALVGVIPQDVPRAESVHVDLGVLLFTLAVSLATGVLFGLVPAFQATRVDVEQILRASARGAVSGGTRSRSSSVLIACEVALAFVLLVAAGVLLQSLIRLGRVQSGLQADHLLTARIALPDVAYPKPGDIAAFHERLADALGRLPGVTSASAVFPLPMSGALTTTTFDLADHPLPAGRQPSAVTRLTGADYFQTMGIPLMRGRFFARSDRLQSPPVVIINERFAQQHFPGRDPIGRRITTGWAVGNQSPQVREVVGVVGNARHLSLREAFVPEFYVPIAQVPYPVATILVRTKSASPETITGDVRKALSQLDPGIPLTAVRPFGEYRAGSLAGARFNVLLLSIFAAVALALTAVGIYGVIAYSVAGRTREIGVRLALGAHPSSIVLHVVSQLMKLVAISLGIGVAGAFACVRLMQGILFGIGAWDPLTFLGTVALLLAVAFVASVIPARLAASCDPMSALRAE